MSQGPLVVVCASLLLTSLRAPAQVVSGPVLEGAVSVDFDAPGQTLRLTAEKVANPSCLVSGPLSLVVYAAPGPVAIGAVPTGSPLAEWGLGPLFGGTSFDSIDTGRLPFNSPPSAAPFYAVVLLSEQRSDGSRAPRDVRGIGWRYPGRTTPMSGGRVTSSVTWRNPYAGGPDTRADAWPTFVDDEFAFFWFTDPSNAEVYVKTLGRNDPAFVQLFAGGTTDFEYSVTWQGCGQIVRFDKPAYSTSGFVNARGIDTSRCTSGCAPLAGAAWRMSLSFCDSDDRKFVQVAQDASCSFYFTYPGFKGFVAQGTLAGQDGEFTFVLNGPCSGSGNGSLSVSADGRSVTGTLSGTSLSESKNCCALGPISGEFSMSR